MTAKRVLFIASNYGVWNEELQAPWDILKEAGHELELATPRGKTPLPLAASVDEDFVDPVQQYNVNTPHACRRMRELLSSGEFDRPLRIADARMADYDAIVMVGGLGADLDLANNPALHRLILDGYGRGKLICAICFSVAALVLTRDPDNGQRSVVYNRTITVHPRAWDFMSDTSYELYNSTPDNHGTDLVTPGFVLPLESIATDAVGPSGHCIANPDTSRERPSVVYDHPFITACSVESSIAYGHKIVEVLECLDGQGRPRPARS
jgi:putative intracellular protease/amidase